MLVTHTPRYLWLTQRQATLSFFALLITFTVAYCAIGIFMGSAVTIIACVSSLPLHILLLTLYQRGWRPAPYIVVVFIALLVGLLVDGTMIEPWPLLPVVMALVLTDVFWIAGIGVGVLLLILARSGWDSAYASVSVLLIYLILVAGMVVSRLIVETALRDTIVTTRRSSRRF
jgi:hypothetical protein